jgi:transposase
VITVKAYILKDARNQELIMVIRTEDKDLLDEIIKKLYKSRNKTIKSAAAILEEDLYDGSKK